MTNPWSSAALALRDREIALCYCQRLLREGSDLYDVAAHQRAVDDYREELEGMRRAIDAELALLPEGEGEDAT